MKTSVGGTQEETDGSPRMPDSMTQLVTAGPPGVKRDLAVGGDGFAEGDQTLYNDTVQSMLLDGVLTRDYFYEDAQAFNVYRVNLASTDSGVTSHTYDSDGNLVSQDPKNTALDTIFTGVWARCWIEDGPNTSSRLNSALSTWVRLSCRRVLPPRFSHGKRTAGG